MFRSAFYKQEAVQDRPKVAVVKGVAGRLIERANPIYTVQWAYLFERFPSFTQTFCVREAQAVTGQGFAPWIFSIRQPRDEPAQDFPAELIARVRRLPAEADLADEFRWLKRCDRVPEGLLAAEMAFKGTRDKARVQEAAWLAQKMGALGVGHVHAHFAGIAARTAYWLNKHCRIGFSFTAHANDIFSAPDPELAVTLADLVSAAKFVATVSDFSAAQLRERFPFAAGKIVRVYNGIDCAAFPKARPQKNGPLVIAVGRYIEKKGFGDLIAACAILRDRGVAFRCQVVGEGPLQESLESAIVTANLRAQVDLTGPKSLGEVGALMSQARVFALPCVKEADGGMDNLPTVIAEAMACGLPVVSTAIAAVPEMVADGKTGAVVPPSSPTALANAISQYLADPALASEHGSRGRTRARRLFSLQRTSADFARALITHTAVPLPRGAWLRDPALAWASLRRASPGETASSRS